MTRYYDILNLTQASLGRDREVVALLSFALRKKGYSVKEDSIFNWRYCLMKYKPRLLLMVNAYGGQINFKVIKYASQLGIPVITFVAEGMVEPDERRMKWGYNVDQVLYEQINCQWSAQARDIITDAEPSLDGRIKVSGGAGFDRYQIYEFAGKEEILKKYSKNYQAVIGVAGWNFATAHHPGAKTEKQEKRFVDVGCGPEEMHEAIERFRRDRIELNRILGHVIKANKDILFLLKYRPNIINRETTEFTELGQYPNVLEIQNEEAIADCLSACDFWMAYESTTCEEAWLLGKQTLSINPSGPDFMFRSPVYRGSPVCRTVTEVQQAIDSFYSSGKIPGFEAKAEARQQVIADTIQWADGKNHRRAAYFIEQMLGKHIERGKVSIRLIDRLKAYAANAAFHGSVYFPTLPVFRRLAHASKNFKKAEVEALSERYRYSLERFYKEHPFTEADVRELEAINHLDGRKLA